MENLVRLTKEWPTIVQTCIIKDDEIKMLINAGIADLNRQGIKADANISESLVQSAIVMYVKSNFGNVDIKEKELAQRTYSLLCVNLSLSEKYKVVENDA